MSMKSSSQASSRNPTHVLSRAINGSVRNIMSSIMTVQYKSVLYADHKDDETLL